MAGEFGHMQVDAAGLLCGCGNRGCWETVASNQAALRYYRKLKGKITASFSYRHLLIDAEDQRPRQWGASLSIRTDRPWPADDPGRAFPEVVLFAGDIVAVWPYFSGILTEELPKNSTRITSHHHHGGFWCGPSAGRPCIWCCNIISVLLLRAPFPVAWLWARVRGRARSGTRGVIPHLAAKPPFQSEAYSGGKLDRTASSYPVNSCAAPDGAGYFAKGSAGDGVLRTRKLWTVAQLERVRPGHQ